MWEEQYLQNTLQLKFQNNGELTRVVAETFKICVNTKHSNSDAELISEFPLSKLGNACRIINIYRLLRIVIHYFEVINGYLSHLF